MKSHHRFACVLALASMASPALADVRTAALIGASERQSPQASNFVGATVRFNLNREHGQPRYRAAFGISRMAYSPQTSELRIGQGLELAFNGSKRPALSLAGIEAQQLRRTANLSGGGKTALIVVGVAAAVGVAALIAVDSLRCEDGGDPCD